MKKTLALVLALLMVLGCMSITAFAAASGTGTVNDPYLLSTLEVNDVIIATDYIKNDTGNMLDYEVRYINSETEQLTPMAIQPDSGETIQFSYSFYYPDNTQFLYKGFDATANYEVGAYVFEQITPEGGEGKSGNTDITLTVAKALTYEMVIPEDVTNLSNFGIYSVGQAKVANVKNATEKTVISYTAETTAFKCEGKTDIPASYYTDEAGQNTFPIDAVTVYENNADAASIPTMWVKITEDAWNAAENGTYTATVTFNFEVKAPKTFNTVADAIDTISDLTVFTNGQSEGASCSWKNEHDGDMWRSINTDPVSDCLTFINWEQCNLPVSTALTKTENGYTCTFDGATFVFAIENDVLKSVTVSNLSDNLNGVWVRPTLAGDILADFPSSENMVTPPQEAWVNENGASAYKFRSMLIFSVPGQDMAYITLGDAVTKSGDDYVWQDRWSGASAVFNMNGETLESIVVSGFTGHYPEDSNGTYTAPAALGETYTVTFDTQGHASIPPRTGVISGSTIFAPIAPVDAGYTFDGWYKEAACTNAWNFDTDTVTADTTLYAKWTMMSPF